MQQERTISSGAAGAPGHRVGFLMIRQRPADGAIRQHLFGGGEQEDLDNDWRLCLSDRAPVHDCITGLHTKVIPSRDAVHRSNLWIVGQLIAGSGVRAGPCRTAPSMSNREAWHGHSHVFSASLNPTMQPRWVQVAET
jgi:hypothetical protein